jgi:hypothetical protein
VWITIIGSLFRVEALNALGFVPMTDRPNFWFAWLTHFYPQLSLCQKNNRGLPGIPIDRPTRQRVN